LQSHIRARVRSNGFSGFPEKPFAFLITCWTGIERGYSAFKFKTDKYAAIVTCPVLIQWGAKDNMVLKYETDKVFNAITSPNKKLVVYENADHESFLENDPAKWRIAVEKFLADNSN
jgi:alpha-beta hydrolase superfamily lysophospholipase